MPDSRIDISKIDPLIHGRVRLAILVLLSEHVSMDYKSLKKVLNITDGNLVSHLRKLEDAGLITVKKSFVGRKPRTTYTITGEGQKRLSEYIKSLKEIISIVISND